MTTIPEEFSKKPTPTGGINLTLSKILLPLAIVLVALFCLAPVMWQLLTSFKVNQDISAIPTVYFPTRYTLNHYID